MLWWLRIGVVTFGIAAWVFSFVLAQASLGSSAPTYLGPLIGAFGGAYLVIGLVTLALEKREGDEKAIRDLENDAFSLADGIREMVRTLTAGTLTVETYNPEEALREFTESRQIFAVEAYNDRYRTRAIRLAEEFNRRKAPGADAMLRLVQRGPSTINNLWQLANGLDRLASQLRERSFD